MRLLPVIRTYEARALLQAAEMLDRIKARGYVDFDDRTGGHKVEHTAASLRALVEVFDGTLEHPTDADPYEPI